MLLDDELSLRVTYHADENMMFMNPDAVSAELRRQSAAKHELYQNEESLQKRLKRIADKQAEQTETFKFIRDPQNKMKRRLRRNLISASTATTTAYPSSRPGRRRRARRAATRNDRRGS